MKTFLTILVLIIVSIPASAQSFIAIGPQLGATTSNGFPGGSQTQAGGLITGQVERPFGPVSVSVGGEMGLFNQPRFLDNGAGSTFEAAPEARMYFPLTSRWSVFVDGGANMQVIDVPGSDSVTVLNPSAGIGLRYWSKDDTGNSKLIFETDYKCLFDDTNNSIGAPKAWRGFSVGARGIKKVNALFGFAAGVRVNRQSNGFLVGPRTQPDVWGGIVIGAR